MMLRGENRVFHPSGGSSLGPWLRIEFGGIELPDQAELAARLGLGHAALRQSLTRLRERFRTTLRAQIADTLRDPNESSIDEELRALRAVLAGRSG